MTDRLRSCKDSPDGCHLFTSATPLAPMPIIAEVTVCRWCGLPPAPVLDRITPADAHLGGVE